MNHPDTDANRPELSIILAAPDSYETVIEAIRSIEAQTVADNLELLVIVDSLSSFGAPQDFHRRHPMARLLEVGRPLLLNEARMIGFRHASADYGFILEDHCLPRADCMEKIISHSKSHRWAVIGPAIENGNIASASGTAANLLTYGEWMGFKHGQQRHFVTGYSSAWHCASLLGCSSLLEQELAIPSRLQQRLRQMGKRIYFAPEAVMVHWEASYWRAVVSILFRQGIGMGFIRRGQARLASKSIGTLLIPLIAGYRGIRGLRAWWRTRNSSLAVALAIPALAVVRTAGELVGYWRLGGQQALRGVSDVERHRQPLINAQREPIRCPVS